MTKQIERLVESTYNDLAPSHHVEEELLADLPAQRARPGLSVPIGIAAIILIGFAIAFSRGGDERIGLHATNGDAPALNLATVARPDSGVVPSAKDDIHVRLLYGGSVGVLQADKWNAVSLDQLGASLSGAKKDRRIVIGVDRNSPWLHVQWLMLICAEQRLPHIALSVQDKSGAFYNLDTPLPTDPGLHHDNDPRPVRARIRVQPNTGKEAQWKGATIRRASDVTYSIDEGKPTDLDTLTRELSAAQRRDPKVHSEIKAPGHTPFWMVADGIAAVRRASIGRVMLYGTAIPSKQVRSARSLPFPKSPWPTRDTEEERRVLEFVWVEGDRKDVARTIALVRERARIAGFDTNGLIATDAGIEWSIRTGADAKLAQQIVERQGVSLEFHITVERDQPEFEREWTLRQKGEKPSKGFQWYPLGDYAKNKYPKSRLPDPAQPLVLCRTDEYGISNASIHRVSTEREARERGDFWAVTFQIREAHQKNMAKLTSVPLQYLAIILDGRIHSAPKLQARLRTHAQITGGFSEPEAKALAVLLQSPALPVRLKLKRR